MTPEILCPFPEIAWASNSFNIETHDLVQHHLGITKIGIGPDLYELQRVGNDSLAWTHREVKEKPGYTRIYLGTTDNLMAIKIVGSVEEPFSLDDPERINSAAEIAKKLQELDISYHTSLQIERIGIGYLATLAHILPGTDENALERIALLRDNLENYLIINYPLEFLAIADDMDRLRIAEILTSDMDHSLTPDFLREAYHKEQTKTA